MLLTRGYGLRSLNNRIRIGAVAVGMVFILASLPIGSIVAVVIQIGFLCGLAGSKSLYA